jgi:ABC-2 type transport system permease protein
VGGICVAGFIAALLMVLVFFGYLLIIGKGATLPLGQTLALSLLFGLVIVALALVCGLLIDNRMGVFWAIVVISTVSSLLGGAFFPVEYAPDFMQQLARVTPAFWFVGAFDGILANDTGSFLASAGVLSLFALLGFLVAAVRFASRSNSLN